MRTFYFRPAQHRDAARVSKLVNSAYRGDSSRQGWTTEADLLGGQRTDPEKMIEIIDEPKSFVLLCFENESEEKLLAAVHLKVEAFNTLYLGMLSVDPTLQAKGVGKALMTEAEQFGLSKGCTSIRLTVIHLREELIQYYERRGFVRTGHADPFPETDPRFGLPKVQGMKLMEMVKHLR